MTPVTLQYSITDLVRRRRYTLYRRADGRYWLLTTPLNPYAATVDNVEMIVVDTLAEARERCQ